MNRRTFIRSTLIAVATPMAKGLNLIHLPSQRLNKFCRIITIEELTRNVLSVLKGKLASSPAFGPLVHSKFGDTITVRRPIRYR